MTDNKELMNSKEFDDALLEGVEYKKNIVTSYKQQNKTNLERFQEVMIQSNQAIQQILDMKAKNRSEDDKAKLKEYNKFISSLYRQTQDLLISEKLEEGQKTKVQKIVDRIAPVILMLRYIGVQSLDQELSKHGISLTINNTLETMIPALATPEKKAVLVDVFSNAKQIKQHMVDDNDKIVTEVFQTKVPVDLQYDSKANNTGLKQNDFAKLVDLKTKIALATSDEAKEKVEDAIEHLAGEKQFEMARAEMIRDKLNGLSEK